MIIIIEMSCVHERTHAVRENASKKSETDFKTGDTYKDIKLTNQFHTDCVPELGKPPKMIVVK